MVILIEHPLFHGDDHQFELNIPCLMVILVENLAGDFDRCSWNITYLSVILTEHHLFNGDFDRKSAVNRSLHLEKSSTHRIHVWYICQHLGYSDGKCYHIYI